VTIVATLKDGRIIARAAISTVEASGAGDVALTATVSELRKIEYVLQWNLSSTATSIHYPRNVSITNNTVGTTLYAVGATTISGEVLVIGY
jgi:hypothetical protein